MHISLGHKKQREGHIERFEDALTSAFFGTLCYLPSFIVVEFLLALLGSKKTLVEDALSKLCLDDVKVEMEFWPNIVKSGRVEPDVKITLASSIVLLIECKWESGASSDFQLLNQWRYVHPAHQSKTFHVYLIKYLQPAIADQNKNMEEASEKIGNLHMREWKDRFLVVSWFEVLKAVNGILIINPEQYPGNIVRQWRDDMEAMFDRIGINEFRGFKHIYEDISEQLVAKKGKLFWVNTFHGFQQFKNNNINSSEDVVFFK